jgi:hypothetical protein
MTFDDFVVIWSMNEWGNYIFLRHARQRESLQGTRLIYGTQTQKVDLLIICANDVLLHTLEKKGTEAATRKQLDVNIKSEQADSAGKSK